MTGGGEAKEEAVSKEDRSSSHGPRAGASSASSAHHCSSEQHDQHGQSSWLLKSSRKLEFMGERNISSFLEAGNLFKTFKDINHQLDLSACL